MRKLKIQRNELGFQGSVEEAFSFLITKCGYWLVRAEPTFVRYESDIMFVNIYHGRFSYELGFEWGLLANGEESRIRLPMILNGLLSTKHGEQTFFQASTKRTVVNCANRLANVVARYCIPLLKGDKQAISSVLEASRVDGREVTQKYAFGLTREQANVAWQKKDYTKVCSLYQSIKEELTPVERRRLEFAHKQVTAKKTKDQASGSERA